jgi:hypothetical protein
MASRGLRDCLISWAKRASLLTRLLSKRKKIASLLIVVIAMTDSKILMEGWASANITGEQLSFKIPDKK